MNEQLLPLGDFRSQRQAGAGRKQTLDHGGSIECPSWTGTWKPVPLYMSFCPCESPRTHLCSQSPKYGPHTPFVGAVFIISAFCQALSTLPQGSLCPTTWSYCHTKQGNGSYFNTELGWAASLPILPRHTVSTSGLLMCVPTVVLFFRDKVLTFSGLLPPCHSSD